MNAEHHAQLHTRIAQLECFPLRSPAPLPRPRTPTGSATPAGLRSVPFSTTSPPRDPRTLATAVASTVAAAVVLLAAHVVVEVVASCALLWWVAAFAFVVFVGAVMVPEIRKAGDGL
jgi:hypothetical protein